jgi:hypothetical protein
VASLSRFDEVFETDIPEKRIGGPEIISQSEYGCLRARIISESENSYTTGVGSIARFRTGRVAVATLRQRDGVDGSREMREHQLEGMPRIRDRVQEQHRHSFGIALANVWERDPRGQFRYPLGGYHGPIGWGTGNALVGGRAYNRRMSTRYEVTTAHLTPKGRVKRTRIVDADSFTQDKGTATFTDDRGRTVATIKRVVRICWP